jgi:hypothetical protein
MLLGSHHEAPVSRDRFTFPIVEEEGGNSSRPRLARVEEVEELSRGRFRLHLSTREGTLHLTVQGDIRGLLQADLGNIVYLNRDSIVPKVDDFTKRPSTAEWR